MVYLGTNLFKKDDRESCFLLNQNLNDKFYMYKERGKTPTQCGGKSLLFPKTLEH